MLLLVLNVAALSYASTIFEPDTPLIDVHYGLIEKDDCREIIRVCEDIGFNNIPDSIDGDEAGNKKSQDIYVFDRDVVNNPRLYKLIQPHLQKLQDFVQERKVKARATFAPDLPPLPADSRPSPDWIFIRKYSPNPGSTRNMLKVHHDINEHSVNLPLNSDSEFEGGGFFVVKPPPQDPSYDYRSAPTIPRKFQRYNYIQEIARKNTSEVYFPHMEAGTALLHNNTVWHGIAPLEAGIKYSLLFFFDMPPPEESRYDPDGRTGDPADDKVVVTFENEYTGSAPIDIFWVPSSGAEGHPVMENWARGEQFVEHTYEGHIFEARNSKTGALMKRWVVERGDENFVFSISAEDEAEAEEKEARRTGPRREL